MNLVKIMIKSAAYHRKRKSLDAKITKPTVMQNLNCATKHM